MRASSPATSRAKSTRPAPLAGLALITLLGCGQGPGPSVRGEAPEAATPPDEAGPDGLSPAQRRGRRIYLQGTSESGRPIEALIGGSRDPIPAALVSCGNCHGRDGHGRPEGGIDPAELGWATLVRPRPAAGRRRRPAYDGSLVGRAIAMGLDPAGEPLAEGMPRYRIAPEDLADLIAYLKVLGTEPNPGVAPDSLTIGTLLPPERSAPGLREAMVRTLKAYAEDVNGRGGFYNRRLLIEFEDLPDSPGRTGPIVAGFLKRRRVFALLGAYIAGREREVLEALRDEDIPLIGPFAIATPADGPTVGRVFHVHSGPDGQARALASSALRRSSPSAAAILLDGDDPAASAAADGVADAWARAGAATPERVAVRGDEGADGLARLVERLSARGIDAVFVFGPPELLRPLAEAADRASWRPSLHLLGASAGGDVLDLPPSFDGRVFLALPYLPEDVTLAGRERYERLASRAGLPGDHRAAQMAVLASASVMEEGLRRCGREVSRARLVEELERLEEFATGFSRPLTFGSSRRVGSWGAYILGADLPARRLRPLGWAGAGGTPR